MSFPRDAYPYTNFHELNLGYFIVHFREIFSQWADLYDQMLSWKNATDEELATWKAGVEADLDQREATLRAELETWKAQTGQDIAGWEDATLAALTAWQTATQAVFEAIRVEAAGSASAAAASAGDAATAKTAAETAQAAAEAAAASVQASAAQITTNTEDIADLKTQSLTWRRALTTSDDLNDIITSGYYSYTSNTVPQNAAASLFSTVLVIRANNDTRVCQITITYASLYRTNIYYRSRSSNGTWTPWMRAARAEELTKITDSLRPYIFYNVPMNVGSLTSSGTATNATNRLRSPYINIDSVIELSCDESAWINYYAYDYKKTFLGRATGTNIHAIASNDILTAYPATKYIRILFGTDNGADLEPEDAATYNLHVYTDREKYYNIVNTFLNNDLLADYLDSNGYLPSGTYAFKTNLEKDDVENYIWQLTAKYEGDTAPRLRVYAYAATSSNQIYAGDSYDIRGKDEFITQELKIPNNQYVLAVQLNITVPENSRLLIKNTSVFHENLNRYMDHGVEFSAHMGFDALYPTGCYEGIISAANLGFKSCVVIPKFTSDGVAVCFHDDSHLAPVITMPDGSAIPTAEDTAISNHTYAQLMNYSIGASKNAVFADQKILKMDDFLHVCAITGMRPIFSVHPQLTVSQWETLKVLLDKYNLTHLLSVKSGNYTETWKRVIDVFGDGNIYSIMELYSTTSTYNVIDYINTGKSTAGIVNTPVECEFFIESLESETYGPTQTTQLENAIAAGYTCSCVMYSNMYMNLVDKYIEKGVTKFTNGRHCSLGLYW